MHEKYLKVGKILEENMQEHLLAFYHKIEESKKEAFLDQILAIDFELIKSLYEIAQSETIEDNGDVTPIEVTNIANLSPSKKLEYEELGLSIMKNGEFAAVTMAGGQGTRLGYNGPKGMYDIGLPSHKSLFQIQCDRLLDVKNITGTIVPWYIMTSKENNDATIEFFKSNKYFGYPKDDIVFFIQGMLPMLDSNGKIILDEIGRIKEGADGHGGIFAAMSKSGVRADMKKRGVLWLFVGGIDNVLVRNADPIFLGFTAQSGCIASGKSVIKNDPNEKAGVFCKKAGHPHVVEYTEISQEMANMRGLNGEYVYGDLHILCNLFSIEVFDMIGENGLPYHKALKKTPYIDLNGNKIVPDKPNAYKFEAFIFDAFGCLKDMAILRAEREKEFAPVKNKDGIDSPGTAKALYIACEKE